MIETDRLILQGWHERDRAAFHDLGNDADTMRYLGPIRSQGEDDAAFDRQRGWLATLGTCGWAVERRRDATLIGMCGIKPARVGLPIGGEMEIGWRFAPEYCGHGYATAAAAASLDHVWRATTVDRVFAITVRANRRSWALMERLGMTRVEGGDFDHPFLDPGDPLRPHITYVIDRPR